MNPSETASLSLPALPRFVFVGTGAIGGYYGGMLARAGHKVGFVGRSDVAAIKRDGLRVKLFDGAQFTVVPPVSADSRELVPADLVVIATKSTTNEQLPAVLEPLIGPSTAILTLQNGLGMAEWFGERFGRERVLGGLCSICLNRVGPGRIENYTRGHLNLAELSGPASPRAHQLAGWFEAAGVRCHANDSLADIVWRKLCWNIPFNGLSIVAGAVTTDVLLASADLTKRARDLMTEVKAAALASQGIAIPDDFLEWQIERTRPMGPYKPSSLIDFVENREVELDPIWGAPLRLGEAAGARLPLMRALYEELRERIAGRTVRPS